MKNKTNITPHYRPTTDIKYLSIFLIFLIFIIFKSTNAQDQWRVFTTQNSPLPSNSVNCMAIDRNNVKWIGTGNGIVRIRRQQLDRFLIHQIPHYLLLRYSV